MRKKIARELIEKNTSLLSKHFSEELELDQRVIQKLQYEIEQAEIYLNECELNPEWANEES